MGRFIHMLGREKNDEKRGGKGGNCGMSGWQYFDDEIYTKVAHLAPAEKKMFWPA